MKKLLLYSFAALLLYSSCRKSDNPKLPDGLESVPLPLLTKDTSADLTIAAQTPEDFNGKFAVGLYFPDGDRPAKMDVVVIKNGDKTKVKSFKTDITTYPTTLSVTGVQLAELFGSPIILNDKFEFGVDITTTNGKKYPAFPAVGVGYGSGVASQPGASPSIRFEAVCQFDAAVYAGDFEVVEDGWADYAPGDVIPVTVINDHQLSFEYPANDARPIIVNVNSATNETSVVKQVFGNYGPQPGDFSVATVAGSADNFVAPCDGVLSVRLNFTSSAGGYGDYVIKLKKK